MDFALDEVDRKLKKDSKQRATQKKRELARPRAIWMVRRCCLEYALAASRRTLGDEHPETLKFIANLSQHCGRKGLV